MTATFFGYATNAAENTNSFDDATVAVTPPASMTAGKLVVMKAVEDTTSGAITISATGGQTWNTLTSRESATSGVTRLFWAIFNGTWGANPSVAPAHPGDFTDFSLLMLVFSPTDSSYVWTVDQAESANAYSAPSTPFDVTTTGQTAAGSSGVFIAPYHCVGGVPTWALQSGGWSNPGVTQHRTGGNARLSSSFGYKIFSAPGASGSVTNRQSATGYPGWQSMITFREDSSDVLMAQVCM